MRGSPAAGSMRRKAWGGLNTGSTALERGGEDGGGRGAKGGLQDRRVAQVLAFRGDRPLQHHVAEALFHVAGKEARQHWVRIKAREAPPHDPPLGVHQGRTSAVANDRKV